jgi:hypothetical protein
MVWYGLFESEYMLMQAILRVLMTIRGTSIDVSKPIVQNFTRKMIAGDPRRAFSDKVITSQLEDQFLPIQYGGSANANMLCKITCDLSTADENKFKVKNRHWWQMKDKYMRVQYEIRVIIGPADITFELCKHDFARTVHGVKTDMQLGFDGQKVSRSDAIEVEWQAAAAPPVETSHYIDVPIHVDDFRPNGNARTFGNYKFWSSG